MISLEQVVEVVRTLDKRRKNPHNDTGCIYTGSDGRHCIAGEVMSRLGFPVPDYGTYYNEETTPSMIPEWYHNLEPRALTILEELQNAADGSGVGSGLNTWGQAMKKCGIL